MDNRLYELYWQVETDVHSFCYREFKVFRSDVAAREYGKNGRPNLTMGYQLKNELRMASTTNICVLMR